MVVKLYPSYNMSCESLPQGIEAQLILSNDKNDILITKLIDFDYNTTKEILFEDVKDFDTETFAVMHIFSYDLIT